MELLDALVVRPVSHQVPIAVGIVSRPPVSLLYKVARVTELNVWFHESEVEIPSWKLLNTAYTECRYEGRKCGLLRRI